MIAKALEENGAKVYILGRRVDVLEKASKEAVSTHFYELDFDTALKWRLETWKINSPPM